MITGLKIARCNSAQKVYNAREKSISGRGPGVGGVNMAMAIAHGGVSSDKSTSISVKYVNDFVWALRLSKITKGLIDKTWSHKTYSRGATFDMNASEPDVKSILLSEGLTDCEIWSIKGDQVENIVVSERVKQTWKPHQQRTSSTCASYVQVNILQSG
ncbi:hypothetical protein CDD82_262 [Ophiocordyceps australis]|uniref:Uncharacterized protein n=1 Tax=Ophiocordyceps australis TaxID=1399860 RepID=A0A2C5XSE0_9HYPO|nr:hypothetical protein CDD82_262 [Ophiocordyceps australis]